MKERINKIIESRYFVPTLLLLNFIIHVAVYFNTTTFRGVSDASGVIQQFENILAGHRPKLLFGFHWFYTPAYIAYFFVRIFGSLNAYFIFQSFLSTITLFIVYRIVLIMSDSKKSGVLAVVLLMIYTEYIMLSSIFYTQVYEIFFTSLFLWMVLLLFKETDKVRVVAVGFTLLLSVLLSLLFRSVLVFSFYYLLIIAVILACKKMYVTASKFTLIALMGIFILVVVKPYEPLREESASGITTRMRLSFWGHTFYGGHGGETTFIYEENEALFNKRLKEFAEERGIEADAPGVRGQFMSYEVNRFVTQEPHKWLFLQGKKFFYTFGSVPQRCGLTMMVTGKVPIHWLLAVLILQLPYLFLILLFILSMDLNIRTIIDVRSYKLFVYLLGAYLISGMSFYATYMERYRIGAFVLIFIPIIAVNYKKVLYRSFSRRELYTKIAIIFIFIAVWIYQAYEAVVLHSDRYFGAIDNMMSSSVMMQMGEVIVRLIGFG